MDRIVVFLGAIVMIVVGVIAKNESWVAVGVGLLIIRISFELGQ